MFHDINGARHVSLQEVSFKIMITRIRNDFSTLRVEVLYGDCQPLTIIPLS